MTATGSTRQLAMVVLLAALSGPAHAAERRRPSLSIDFVQGISIPIADDGYKVIDNPSYKLGVRAGAVFPVAARLWIAPELEFDFVPMSTRDFTYAQSNARPRLYRERALVGARLVVPIGMVALYGRLGIGLDHIGGLVAPKFVLTAGEIDWSSTAFTVEPGIGIEIVATKHLTVGMMGGIPIVFHDFGDELTFVNPTNPSAYLVHVKTKLTTVDVDILATIGVRW